MMPNSIRFLVVGTIISLSLPAAAQDYSRPASVNELERLPTTWAPDAPQSDPASPDAVPDAATIYLQPATGEPAWTTPPPPSAEGSSWYPGSWQVFEYWDATFELGINGGAGNAESLSLKTGVNIEREVDGFVSKLDVSYARTTSATLTTQDLFIADLRMELEFGESPWSIFFNENFTRDKLRPFDWRVTLNAGGGYKFFDNDWTKLNGRFGAGVSREFGGPSSSAVPEGVFGMDYDQKLTEKQKLSAVVDYFPDWGNFDEYRVTAKAGWELVLDKDPNLSLKFEVSDRYDSTPDGAKPNDINYSILLLWTL